MAEWLKMKALSSSPSTTKKKKKKEQRNSTRDGFEGSWAWASQRSGGDVSAQEGE
jgi:hypothetical protein